MKKTFILVSVSIIAALSIFFFVHYSKASYPVIPQVGGGTATTSSFTTNALILQGASGYSYQAFGLGSGGHATDTPAQLGIECRSGYINYPEITGTSAQQVTIITGIPGDFRYDHAQIQESTKFVSSSSTSPSALTVSMGRPSAAAESIPAFSLMSSSAPQNFWNDRPSPNLVGHSNTYSLVLEFTPTAGNMNLFTAGKLNWEVCGYFTGQ